ncbi:cupredoxin domain-containing protein [Candidatus Methanoperedens nitratireducens]|uniref:EfeO-type cupredoxin-like domain-containing protein n=1 Tax=Candidatus Methanoperedens nitratireducens TaxID=1392998 RepID=A0A284VS45_9EURY|nr:cupredoxin domain-containing protein [Candidatus Methanoperedens nitroreducens]SNQ62029.1 hypothetical protein MNV_560075 [Candidatus Methanoperedens nitroreducens]
MQKKHITEIIAGLLVLLATAGTIVGALVYEDNLYAGRKVIELQARAPERGNWSMQEIHLIKGEPVTLKIRNVDTVSHGFAIPELGISLSGAGEIKPGNVATIEFIPDTTGSFMFTCTTWCSTRHMQMTGKIIVSEK